MGNHISIFSSAISKSAGGIENTTYYLANYLSKYFEVDAYLNRCEDKVPGIKVYTTNEKNYFKRLIKFLCLFKKYKGDTSACLCMNWKYALVPFLVNSPYILLCHGAEVLNYTHESVLKKIENIFRNMVIKRAQFVCANSQFTYNLVKKNCKSKNVVIIHPCIGNDVDFNRVYPTKKYILSIGRLDERKGFQYAIKAFAALHQTYPDIKYYIAGDGKYKNELTLLIKKLKLTDNCILLGKVSEDKKVELIQSCIALVMPSFYISKDCNIEGFGIVYLEANAYGKPVIGTYSGGIPDAIKDGVTGILVNEKNSNQIVTALSDILTKEKKFDDRICKKWAAKHHYTLIASKYQSLLIQVCNNFSS